jgi:hypothetical protein
MSDARPIPNPVTPVIVNDDGSTTTEKVPPRVRTFAYFALLAVAAIVTLVTGIVAVWWPALFAQVSATGAVVLSVAGLIGGGLGVAYRPTR